MPAEERIEQIKRLIDFEFEKYGAKGQFERDVWLWKKTFVLPDDPRRREILKRIFSILRFGGVMYKKHKEKSKSSSSSASTESKCKCSHWKYFAELEYPLASLLAHGGRVLIQFDAIGSDKHGFWKWLLTGSPTGKLEHVVSTKASGDECKAEKKLIFRRYAATHSIDYLNREGFTISKAVSKASSFISSWNPFSSTSATTESSTTEVKEENVIVADEDVDGYHFHLPEDKHKLIKEIKTFGISTRDTKVLSNDQYLIEHHRHWGMNVSFGGDGLNNLKGEVIASDGQNSHLYLYYMPPRTGTGIGGILIGLEGSEYGKFDVNGAYHGISAASHTYSPSHGYKWVSKDKKRSLSSYIEVPGKKDSLFVDITHTSGNSCFTWSEIQYLSEYLWNNDMLGQPPLQGKELVNLKKTYFPTTPTVPLSKSTSTTKIIKVSRNAMRLEANNTLQQQQQGDEDDFELLTM